MPTLQELKEKRANVWSQMEEVRDAVEKDGWTDELRQKWDRADGELEQLTADIERDERNEDLNKRFSEIDEQNGNRSNGAGGAGGDGANLEDEYRQAFETFVRFGSSDMPAEQRQLLQQRAVDTRAQGVGTGAIGGFTVPEDFWQKVTETMLFFANVAAVSESITTSQGNTLPWPTNDDTANEGSLLTENTQISEQDLAFGQAQLDAYMYTSELVRVAIQLLQDSGVNIESFLARKLGERLGRIINRHFTVGTGTGQPQGYTVGATQGATSSLAGDDTFNSTQNAWRTAVDLIHSVDVAYRGNARFALHDLILAKVRKWRDADGRPLWQPSTAVGVPDTILGYPYFVNNYQDSVSGSANDLPLFFGNFEAGFVTRAVSGGMLRRLDERYADFLQVGFFAFSRHDSVVQDSSAIKYLEIVA